MKLRAHLYHTRILHQASVAVPVVSVGNLVLGGTGKTPVVRHIAEVLRQYGYQPAIISRGYKGKANKKCNIVSNRTDILLSPDEAGDEPYMLASSLPGVPVLTGTRRIHPARVATTEFNADVLILDDGFQHLAICRDVDIVLFDATTLAGNSRIFPGGPLREPVSALNRSQVFLITGQTRSNRERSQQFAHLLTRRFPHVPVFYSYLNKGYLTTMTGEKLDQTGKMSFFGFCGIANPERFVETAHNIDINVKGICTLSDHVTYSSDVVKKLNESALGAEATAMVTTTKDAVKLQDCPLSLPLYILHVSHELDKGFDTYLLSALDSPKSRHHLQNER